MQTLSRGAENEAIGIDEWDNIEIILIQDSANIAVAALVLGYHLVSDEFESHASDPFSSMDLSVPDYSLIEVSDSRCLLEVVDL